MRLNYRFDINQQHSGGAFGPNLIFVRHANYGTDPEYRVYEDGTIPPAYTPLPAGNLNVPLVVDKTYVFEYRDSIHDLQIAKFNTISEVNSCWNNLVGSYQEQGSSFLSAISDTRIFVSHTIYFLNWDGVTNRQVQASIDGGVTWKTMAEISSGATFANMSVEWSNSEIDALGGLDTLDIRFRNVRTACVSQYSIEQLFDTPSFDPLSVDYNKTDCTAIGSNDGTISLIIAGGSGNRTYLWNDGAVTENRSNLSPGIYYVTVTDTTTLEEITTENIQIFEPQPEPLPEGSILQVPILNSLHFVVDPIVADNIISFQNPDNTLFADQVYPRMKKGTYHQKVCFADDRIVQFYSDFPINVLELYDCKDQLIKTIEVILKEDNLGKVDDYLVTIRNHVDEPGKSRVYFNVGAIPIPLKVGDVFEILNNLDGFDGPYSILAIDNDPTLGYQYLVINRNYDAPNPTSGATGRFVVSNADFNVYEGIIMFSDVPEGLYYAKISASDLSTTKVAISEPILVKEVHENTNLITYRNNDNAFDITWTTGYIGKIRVESNFFKREVGGVRSVSRNSDYSLTKVSAKKTRTFTLETLHLPPYMHEKLAVIFDCDHFSINGVACQSDQAYGNYQYLDPYYPLFNASINVEQASWMDKYNTDDIGSVNEGGFLLTETGFLKL